MALTRDDVGCWLLKSTRSPDELSPGWAPAGERVLERCVRPSYRLGLMTPGDPCLLWVSGRRQPGVHALGRLAGPVVRGADGPTVVVRLTRLAEPIPRADLLADPATADAEVLRMPAGSNPSWLSPLQLRTVLDRLQDGAHHRGPWAHPPRFGVFLDPT